MAEKKRKQPEPEGDAAMTKAAKRKRAPAKPRPKRKGLPQFHVILLDDDDHTDHYVVEMLQALFAHPPEKGVKMAKEVDTTGRVIVMTTHKEAAELKRDQILAYGADPRVQECQGSMTAIIEPAPE